MKKILLALLTFSSIALAKEVSVSIVPQKFFVKKIAGNKIDVNVMVKDGFSPATYEPKTSQMKKLSNSLIYFSIGVPFEKTWLERFKNTNKKMLIINTAKNIKKIQMQKHHHKKDEKEEHLVHHKGLDPHIWLDPLLVKIQAKNIYEALVKIDEKNKDFYLTNYKKFIKELEELNDNLTKILKPYDKKAFMVFHPSWGYFAKRYNLEQISVEVQGKEPKPADLINLVKEAKEHHIKIVFVSPQFSQKGAKTIAKSIKGQTLVINPLALKWDKNLLKVANTIAKTYK